MIKDSKRWSSKVVFADRVTRLCGPPACAQVVPASHGQITAKLAHGSKILHHLDPLGRKAVDPAFVAPQTHTSPLAMPHITYLQPLGSSCIGHLKNSLHTLSSQSSVATVFQSKAPYFGALRRNALRMQAFPWEPHCESGEKLGTAAPVHQVEKYD